MVSFKIIRDIDIWKLFFINRIQRRLCRNFLESYALVKFLASLDASRISTHMGVLGLDDKARNDSFSTIDELGIEGTICWN